MSTRPSEPSVIDDGTEIRDMINDWKIHLGQKSPSTIKIYIRSAERLATFLESSTYPVDYPRRAGQPLPTGVAGIGTLEVNLFFCAPDMRALSEVTRSQIYRALKRFFAFLLDEEEIQTNPLDRVEAPSQKPVLAPVVDIDDLRRLVATCDGNGIEERRDMAVLRLLIDTGMRIGELASMKVEDVELERGIVSINGTRGTRQLRLEPQTVEALRRYLRVRGRHPRAGIPELWLALKGNRTGVLTHWGLRQILDRRVEQAGLTGRIYPHKLRHTYAHRWLANGNQEHDLMLNAGWSSPSMITRYRAAAASERARAAALRAGLAGQIQGGGTETSDKLGGMTRMELLAARAGMRIAIGVVEALLATNAQATADDALTFLRDRLALMPE